MKNNILFLLAVISVLSVTSCKKKIESCKLGKSYISDGNTSPNPNTFFYYSDGRLQKIVYTRGTRDTLAYQGDSIFIRSLAKDYTTTSAFAGVLNSNGHVDAGTKISFDYLGNIVSTEEYSMTYNADGNLTQQVTSYSLSSDILQFFYNTGNADSAVLYVGGIRDKKYIFYHGTAENKTGIDDLRGVFNPYFGKPSRNLLDSTRILTSASDTIRIQYAHTLDENDYVSNTIQTYLNSGVETKYSTYQYFDCSE